MELKELCQAIANGQQVQISHSPAHSFINTTAESALNHFLEAGKNCVRIAPTLKPVDMSVLVDSGIDCEFSGVECFADPAVGQISAIGDEKGGYLRGMTRYGYCRPRLDHWHSPKNCGGIPMIWKRLVEAGFDVELDEDANYVHAFRISGESKGRCYPWEAS